MKHFLFFTIAFVVAVGVFLRVWSTAPAYEKRQRTRAELSTLTTKYSTARRETYMVVQLDTDPLGAILSYLEDRPQDLVRRAHADAVMPAMGASLVWGWGRDEEAERLWRAAADALPSRVTKRVAGRMGIVRRVAAARTLVEVDRIDEARAAAESCQDWADSRSEVEIEREQSMSMLGDLGWVWSRLGDDAAAKRNWVRQFEFYEGERVLAYKLACLAALAGERERALRAIARAVDEWDVEAMRVFFTLDLLDNDPDLDAIRAEPEFIAARAELVRKTALREIVIAERLENPLSSPDRVTPEDAPQPISDEAPAEAAPPGPVPVP